MIKRVGRLGVAALMVMVGTFAVSSSPVAADASQDNVCERGRVCLYNNRDRSNGVAEYVWDDKNYANNTFNHSRCGVFRRACGLNDSTSFLENRGANNDVCHYADRDWGRFRFRSLRGQNWNTGDGLSSHKWHRLDRACPGS